MVDQIQEVVIDAACHHAVRLPVLQGVEDLVVGKNVDGDAVHLLHHGIQLIGMKLHQLGKALHGIVAEQPFVIFVKRGEHQQSDGYRKDGVCKKQLALKASLFH